MDPLGSGDGLKGVSKGGRGERERARVDQYPSPFSVFPSPLLSPLENALLL